MPQRWWQYQLLVHTMPPPPALPAGRSWHLGTGASRTDVPGWSELNTERCLEESNGYIFTGASGRAQVKKFKEAAMPGDKIYLHTRGEGVGPGTWVTHVGVYTGEISQNLDPHKEHDNLLKMYPLDNGEPGSETVAQGRDRMRHHEYFISVSEWLELPHPFKGKGLRTTLYEAPEYPSRAEEAQDAALRNL